MKYNLNLNSKPIIPIDEKHSNLIDALINAQPPWKLSTAHIQNPDFGTHFMAQVSLTKWLEKSIKGFVSYRYRRLLENTASHDDYITLDFNPKHIDFKYTAHELLPQLITAFDAYHAEISNEELIYEDAKTRFNKDIRKDIIRFYPVHFMSAELCLRTLGLTCEEVRERVSSHVEDIIAIGTGILIVSAYRPLTVPESNDVHQRLHALLS